MPYRYRTLGDDFLLELFDHYRAIYQAARRTGHACDPEVRRVFVRLALEAADRGLIYAA